MTNIFEKGSNFFVSAIPHNSSYHRRAFRYVQPGGNSSEGRGCKTSQPGLSHTSHSRRHIMPIKFSITPRKDPRNQESAPKYYATVKSDGRADTQPIAKSINSISTVSSVDTAAVLEAFSRWCPKNWRKAGSWNWAISALSASAFRAKVRNSRAGDRPQYHRYAGDLYARQALQAGAGYDRVPKGEPELAIPASPQGHSANHLRWFFKSSQMIFNSS